MGGEQVSRAGGQGQAEAVSGQIITAAIEVHRQLGPGLTYLRLSGRRMGLLVNFNTDLIEHGLHRMLDG